MTDAPRISDAEINELHEAIGHGELTDTDRYYVRQALAAFLRARVPPITELYEGGSPYDRGFNACRDLVLKGRE